MQVTHANMPMGHSSPVQAFRTLVYSFRRCCADVMADSTDSLLTRDLMLEAVPYSSPSIFETREICSSSSACLQFDLAYCAMCACNCSVSGVHEKYNMAIWVAAPAS